MDQTKLQEIKDAENEAQSILDAAKKEANAIIGGAGEQGIAILDSEKNSVKEKMKSILDRFKKEGDDEAAKILQELPALSQAIEKKASGNIAKASEFLKQKFRDKYGNR